MLTILIDKYPFYGTCLRTHQPEKPVRIRIKFEQIPNQEQQEKMIATAPIPLLLEKTNFNQSILSIEIDLEDNDEIDHIYDQYNDPNDNFHFWGYSCGRGALNAFEEDIIRWMIEVHNTICPIVAAVCYPDDFSKPQYWHSDESLQQIPTLICALDQSRCHEYEEVILNVMKTSLFKFGLHKVASLKDVLPRVSAIRPAYQYLKIDNLENVLEAIRQNRRDDFFISLLISDMEDYCKDKDYSLPNEYVYAIYKLLMDTYTGKIFSLYRSESAPRFIIHSIETDDSEIMQEIENRARTDSGLRSVLDTVYQMMFGGWPYTQERDWAFKLKMFDYLMNTNIENGTFYCNALYAAETRNTGLPLNKERNYKFLKVCLQHAEEDFTTYINAACVYNEMQEYDKAFDCAQKYFEKRIESRYKDVRKRMLEDLKTDKAFEEFRQQSGVKSYLNSVKI